MTVPDRRPTSPARRPGPAAYARGLSLLLVLGIGWWLVATGVLPSPTDVRSAVRDAGAWAPAVFVAAFAGLTLVATPRNVLTTIGAALFGIAGGIVLSWIAALIGAVAAFGLARLLGADTAQRLTRGRLERVDTVLRDHGTAAVVAARLLPVVPFSAVNYGAGVLGVRLRDFTLGTAVGIIPGTLAYAALGTYALDDPWAFAAVGVVLVVLFVAGSVAARRLWPRRQPEQVDCRRPEPESVDAAL